MPTARAAPSRVGTRLTLHPGAAASCAQRLLRALRCGTIGEVMPSTVYMRTLHKAAELLGGRKPLARHLRVPLEELEKWMSGTAVPPMGVFLKAVDLVLDETSGP